MNQARFPERRSPLAWLAFAAIVSVSAGLACADEDPEKQCSEGKVACGKVCADLLEDRLHCGGCGVECSEKEVCSGGQCVPSCPSEMEHCDGLCVHLDRDWDNCGTCGNACPAGELCSRGECTSACGQGMVACERSCVDVQTDALNCGECGEVCQRGMLCEGGSCVPNCQDGLSACEGGCVDFETNALHCGACGNACAAGELCAGGVCALSCQEGFEVCDGICTDPMSDRNHCGECGASCGDGEICKNGSCVPSCPMGWEPCAGFCVDLDRDDTHCGACGETCDPGEVCEDGVCKQDCPDGWRICGGLCVDPETNRSHCGGCGQACAPGMLCEEGGCVVSCQQGLLACDGGCIDPGSDHRHCGECGVSCAPGEVCNEGSCTPSCPAPTTLCTVDDEQLCVDLENDPTNCGACGRTCELMTKAFSTCSKGECRFVCEAGWGDCDNNLVNGCETSLDSLLNCGACGYECPAASNSSPSCSSGVCEPICDEGWGDCDGDPTNGCETKLDSNPHCGACGQSCVVCDGGSCIMGRRIFVTSTEHQGNLGGIAGADAICQARADVASLGGTWLALISDDETPLYDRHRGSDESISLIGFDGVQIAIDWSYLETWGFLGQVRLNEFLETVPTSTIWTGQEGKNCSNWTSDHADYQCTSNGGPNCARVGMSSGTGTTAVSLIEVGCERHSRLYCLEQAE